MQEAPHPQGSSGVQRAPRTAVALMMVAAIVAVGLISWAGSTLLPASPSREYREAVAQCEALVSDELRSPSSAVFESDVSSSGSTWRVTGAVDSQNGFGAIVRTEFECSVTIEGDDVRALLTQVDPR